MPSLAKASLAALALAASAVAADDWTRLFVFGSSSSANGFDINGRQPSVQYPFGNTKPKENIDVNSGGWNYAEFLTDRYNKTPAMLYDFAVNGAVTDEPGSNDMLNQVSKKWRSKYSGQQGSLWKPDESIFILYIGNNDVYNNRKKDPATTIPKIMESYWDTAVKNLYADKARKFLVVGVSSQEESPRVKKLPPNEQKQYLAFRKAFNEALKKRTTEAAAKYKDAKFRYFSTTKVMRPILADLQKYGFNSDAMCLGTKDKCFWMNDFHVTTQVHELLAKAMAPVLKEIGGKY